MNRLKRPFLAIWKSPNTEDYFLDNQVFRDEDHARAVLGNRYVIGSTDWNEIRIVVEERAPDPALEQIERRLEAKEMQARLK